MSLPSIVGPFASHQRSWALSSGLYRFKSAARHFRSRTLGPSKRAAVIRTFPHLLMSLADLRLSDSQFASCFEAQMAVDHVATTAGEHRNLEPEFSYRCHHAVHRSVVLARVARVKSQFALVCIGSGLRRRAFSSRVGNGG